MFIKYSVLYLLVLLLAYQKIVFGDEEEQVQSQAFIDKTSLVKEFFKKNSTLLVTVPRGFGKTTNMDMIRRFCEIQVDKEGCVIPRNETKYFKIFSNMYLKEGVSSFLDVFQDCLFFNRFFAQNPVIYMDFTLLSIESWHDFKNSLVKIIHELFNSHNYLLCCDNLNDNEKMIFRNYQFQVICKELKNDQLIESVAYLASLLYKHFSKKIVLLIDEVDSVIHDAIMKGCKNIEDIFTFIADFISNALNSKFMIRSIVNSSSRLVKVLLKGIGNIDHFIFNQNHPFNQFYGFTEKEVIHLAEIFNIKNNISTIREWYNGYKISKSDLNMFNFYSVSNLLFKRDIGIYSIKGRYPKKFEHLFLKGEIRRKVKTIINNGIIKIKPIKEISTKHILKLKEIFETTKSIKIDPNDESLLFGYMLDLGYFTVVNYHENHSELSLKVPNVESKSELMDLVYSIPYFKIKLNLTDEEIITANETLLDSKISEILKEPVLSSS